MNEVQIDRVMDKLLQQIASLNRTNAILSVRVEDLTEEVETLRAAANQQEVSE